MRLGIMHTIVRASALEGAFQAAAELRAEGVEVYYRQAQELLESGHADRLKALSDKQAVEIPSLCLGFLAAQPSLIGTPKMIGDAQRMISKGLAVAEQAGAKVVLVPCVGKNSIETEQELTTAADALADMVEQAEQAKLTIAIESFLNVNQQQFLLNYLGDSPAVRVYYDTGNVLSRKLDAATGIRDLGPGTIAQVHFKDVQLKEAQPPDYNVLLGQGNVDFRAVAQALRAIGFDGWVILETPPVGDPLESAAANLAFARSVLGA